MRPSVRTLAVATATLAALSLGACTGPLPFLDPGPAVTLQDGPAPSVTAKDRTLRADQITRADDRVAVALTMGNAGFEQTLASHHVQVSTDAGVKLKTSDFAPRKLASGSAATFTLDVPLPEKGTRALDIRVNDAETTVRVPVPDEDGTWAWSPAPLRQVALAQKVERSEESELVINSLRTEGLLTEVDVRGSGLTNALRLCTASTRRYCVLTEPDGTNHPLLGDTDESAPGLRQSAVLRFLGELKPDTTDVQLTLARHWTTNGQDTVNLTLPSAGDSRVRVASGDLGRPPIEFTPVDLTYPTSEATVRVTGVDVLSDHVQVKATATAGPTQPLGLDNYLRQKTMLREPNGFIHPLATGKDVALRVEKGQSLDVTLVFRGSVPADVTELTLVLSDWWKQDAVATTFSIPSVDAGPDTQAPTFAEASAVATPAAPEVRATVAAPDPSATAAPTAVALGQMEVTSLPLTTSSVRGAVFSTAGGLQVGAKVASGAEVVPQADAEAQRSLQDLGAQKTPDGYVLTLPETVLFDYNKADLLPSSSATIDRVAELLAYYDRAKIGVNGHTDSTGNASDNQDLSQRRAQAVADALAGRSVASSRLTVAGFAATQPVASNGDDAGRAKNRRVEIVLRENG